MAGFPLRRKARGRASAYARVVKSLRAGRARIRGLTRTGILGGVQASEGAIGTRPDRIDERFDRSAANRSG